MKSEAMMPGQDAGGRDGSTSADANPTSIDYGPVFDVVNDAIFVHDAQTGAILDVNRRAEEMYGWTREEMRTCSVEELSEGHAPYSQQDAVERLRAARSGVAQVFEWRAKTRAGGLFWVEVNINRVTMGGHDRLVAVVRDITERKRAAEALRESDRHKGEFLAILSHELRNPLASIRNALWLLEQAEPGGGQAARATATIKRQANQLAHLVDDLLDVTRISRGKIHLQRSRLDLVELVRRTVEDYRPLFSAADLSLTTHLGELPIWIDADATRVAQAVGNVLANAAKFSDPGGSVVVAVEREAGGRALVSVRDEGAGIARDVLGHLFEPFVQADTTLHRARGGLGLGLSIVKGFVELHGGSVEVRSEGPDRGTEVIIQLPLAPEEPVIQSPARAARRGMRRRRVLVIEDNVDAAETLREMLLVWNQEVEVAHDGGEGLEKARAFHPDIVLCDIGLPVIDGYQVARAMRSDPEVASTFLVAVTGYASTEDQRKAADAGFNRHLGKPVPVEVIEEVLATAPSIRH